MIFYLFIYLVYAENDDDSSNYNYKIVDYQTTETSISITAQCTSCSSYYIKKNNYVANTLNITIILLSINHLNIVIQGSEFSYQYEMPHNAPFPDYSLKTNFSGQGQDYQIATVSNPLRITVTRISTKEVLFDTYNYRLVYSRFYIEISTKLTSKYLYGLGERNEIFWLQNGTYSFWNRAPQNNVSNSTNYSSNSYGTQPIYLARETNLNYHVAFLRNLNAMDIVFNNTESDPNLQYRIVIY